MLLLEQLVLSFKLAQTLQLSYLLPIKLNLLTLCAIARASTDECPVPLPHPSTEHPPQNLTLPL